MRGIFNWLFCILFVFLFAGCWVESYVDRPGVEGRLVDSEKGMPVAKKKIKVSVDGKTFSRRTNSKGEFKVGPGRGYYLTWVLCGPILIKSQFAEISIEQDGYQDYMVYLMDENARGVPYFPYYQIGHYEDERFLLGDILLEKVIGVE